MFGYSIVGMAIGFGVGWFVLKRPAWAEKIVNKVFG